jgi:hypothetical protein
MYDISRLRVKKEIEKYGPYTDLKMPSDEECLLQSLAQVISVMKC